LAEACGDRKAPKARSSTRYSALGTFDFAYNRISDAMPGFLAELDSIWPKETAKTE
jgi:hypothetical protein